MHCAYSTAQLAVSCEQDACPGAHLVLLAVDGCSCDSVDNMHSQGNRVRVQVLCEEALRGPSGHKGCAGV